MANLAIDMGRLGDLDPPATTRRAFTLADANNEYIAAKCNACID